jgi:uncharacterized protein YqjF (DUF2071 family)
MASHGYRSESRKIFLTAEWLNLAMLNYEVHPNVLLPHVPRGTELDLLNGRAFLSLVGFQFLKTRVLGMSFPFHRNFEEINLRFYVKRYEGSELQRGVVFIKEIVPRWAIAVAARAYYGEKYVCLPMSHEIAVHDPGRMTVEYNWKLQDNWNRMTLETSGAPQLPADNSDEQFISEHYWGYSAQENGGTMEYRVDHPSWRVWKAASARFAGDTTPLYGQELAALLAEAPASAFLAEGSRVVVYRGRKL